MTLKHQFIPLLTTAVAVLGFALNAGLVAC